jgi:hypothetical protein
VYVDEEADRYCFVRLHQVILPHIVSILKDSKHRMGPEASHVDSISDTARLSIADLTAQLVKIFRHVPLDWFAQGIDCLIREKILMKIDSQVVALASEKKWSGHVD